MEVDSGEGFQSPALDRMSPSNSTTGSGGGPVSLRVYHECERARNGRIISVDDGGSVPGPDERLTMGVTGAQIYGALADSTDLERYVPHVYDESTEAFVAVQPGPGHFYAATRIPGARAPRLDVRLLSRGVHATPRAEALVSDSASSELRAAWFGIGIVRGKVASNHGTLWRSALQLGASYTFTLGRRYDKKSEGAADVFKSHRQMPCFGYESVAAFAASAPVDAQWVAVEHGGAPLAHFRHPKRAVYILGSEDAGLPPALVARAHHHVSIPVTQGRPASLNVAAAGAIVMWDRMLKISAASRAADANDSLARASSRKRFSMPTSTTAITDDDYQDAHDVPE